MTPSKMGLAGVSCAQPKSNASWLTPCGMTVAVNSRNPKSMLQDGNPMFTPGPNGSPRLMTELGLGTEIANHSGGRPTMRNSTAPGPVIPGSSRMKKLRRFAYRCVYAAISSRQRGGHKETRRLCRTRCGSHKADQENADSHGEPSEFFILLDPGITGPGGVEFRIVGQPFRR